ncbi:MAG TPA: hypothetical protein VIS99_16660 [Terrimicrobiaceae bacterium]
MPQFDVKADPYQTPSPLRDSKPDSNFPSINGKLALASDHTLPLPLMPYDLRQYISVDTVTGDLVHTFYHQQLQIDNGALEPKNGDLGKFVTWSDNPGLVLSFIDATNLPEGKLAQEYPVFRLRRLQETYDCTCSEAL